MNINNLSIPDQIINHVLSDMEWDDMVTTINENNGDVLILEISFPDRFTNYKHEKLVVKMKHTRVTNTSYTSLFRKSALYIKHHFGGDLSEVEKI